MLWCLDEADGWWLRACACLCCVIATSACRAGVHMLAFDLRYHCKMDFLSSGGFVLTAYFHNKHRKCDVRVE